MTEMIVWIVIRRAVYRHEIGGVFSSEVLARSAAEALLETEPDRHHIYEIVPFALDQISTRDYSRFDWINGNSLSEPESIFIGNSRVTR